MIVYGDGQQSRDFTYVDDVARGTLAALKPMGYEVINLGSDRPVVLMDAIRLVEELVGEKAHIEYKPRHPADVLATWADIPSAAFRLGSGQGSGQSGTRGQGDRETRSEQIHLVTPSPPLLVSVGRDGLYLRRRVRGAAQQCANQHRDGGKFNGQPCVSEP